MFKQGAFQIDPNATPDQIARKRELIRAMMPKYGSARYVGEGLGQLFYGIGSGRQENALDKQESAGRKSAADQFGRLFGTANSAQSPDVTGPLSVLGMTPTEPAPPTDPNSPGAIAGDAMAALGKQVYTPGDKDSFIKAMMPHAIKVSQETGLDPRVVIAQAAQETGWGKSAPGNNFFGIKSHGKGGGNTFATNEVINGETVRINDSFRGYDSMGDSAMGYAEFLQENPRYSEMLAAGDLDGQIDALGRSGYATDPNYASSVRNIAMGIGLPEGFTPGQGVAPSGAAPSPTSAPSIPINELYMALQNPWMSAEEKGLITSMIQEQQAASDPLKQIELQKAQLELDQMQNPTQQPPEDFTARMFTLNSLQIDPQSEEGRTYLMTGELPEPPEPGFSTMTAEEVAQLGLPPGSYQRGPKGEIKQIGGGGTNVTVNNVPGTPPSDEALRKKLMEAEGTSWGEYLKAGGTASGMRQDMELLGQVIEMAPQGPVTGRLAEAVPGVSDAAGVFQSVVKRIAPSLRVEGSGAQSDIEYNGFLQSLPSLSNRPEANRAIKTFLESKAAINMERGQVIQEYQNGEIDAAAARKKIKEIDSRSIMSPELEGLLGEMDGGAAPSGTAAPEGVEQEVWDALTPEERALWD